MKNNLKHWAPFYRICRSSGTLWSRRSRSEGKRSRNWTQSWPNANQREWPWWGEECWVVTDNILTASCILEPNMRCSCGLPAISSISTGCKSIQDQGAHLVLLLIELPGSPQNTFQNMHTRTSVHSYFSEVNILHFGLLSHALYTKTYSICTPTHKDERGISVYIVVTIQSLVFFRLRLDVIQM